MDPKARRRRRTSRWQYPSIEEVAAVLVLAPPFLPWKMEAPTRHRIRVLLVLQGMPWERADWLGHSLVARARIAAGIRQPAGWDSDQAREGLLLHRVRRRRLFLP
jgi:hypothetical protein